MEHFAVIQALCRSALTQGSPAVKRQVERLCEALTAAGSSREAAALRALLNDAERAKSMTPSRLVQSDEGSPGEALSTQATIPTDRETAAPLAAIVMPESLPETSPVSDLPKLLVVRTLAASSLMLLDVILIAYDLKLLLAFGLGL